MFFNISPIIHINTLFLFASENQILMFNFKTMRKHLVTVSLLLTSLFTNAYALNNNSDFNNGWKFTLSDSACYSFVNYNPSSWKTVNLPHDWSVDLPFESTAEGCTVSLKVELVGIVKHLIHPTISLIRNAI